MPDLPALGDGWYLIIGLLALVVIGWWAAYATAPLATPCRVVERSSGPWCAAHGRPVVGGHCADHP